MAFPLYLAMTAAEFCHCKTLPPHPAWMACHFSPYGTGLSNIPETTPPDAMVIVNDRIPVHGHDPSLIAEQLQQLVNESSDACVLLDFQRPDNPETVAIARKIVSTLPCPVGVSSIYAGDLDCAVFYPLLPSCRLPQTAFPQQQRDIWLEVCGGCNRIDITPNGFHSDWLPPDSEPLPHADSSLCVHYRTEVGQERITFYLQRTKADWDAFFQSISACGVTRAVALYQQWT